MRTIIDTHVHLDELPDIDRVLVDCAREAVTEVIALGVDLASNRKHGEFRAKEKGASSLCLVPGDLCPKIHLAFGLHPGNITTLEETDACLAFIREHIAEAVAIGEMGLDYHYKWVTKDEAKKKEQQEVFVCQLELAKEFHLPAVVHSRGAYQDCLTMTRTSGVVKANFHWYTGPIDILKEILDAGFMVSVSPSLEYSPEARAVAEYAPLDRLLVETDTPVRGWKPQDVWRTLKLLSGVKGMPEDEVLAVVNANARVFFGLETIDT